LHKINISGRILIIGKEITGMKNSNERYYYIITYGCQMNVHDSEKMAGMLEEMGYHQTDDINYADIILLNTCIIRENAELKVFGKLGELKKLKRKNKNLIIGIGGCMMQVKEVVDVIKAKYPQVDLIFGTHNILRLPELINRFLKERKRVIEIWNKEKGLIPETPFKRDNDLKAWVTIIQGCNNFCTYCIVPYVRGRERSRPINCIKDEVKGLVNNGIKEITLLGQNVNSYGNDLDINIDFADLLNKLNKINGLYRIRYMTSHPKDFTQKLINEISKSDKVCEHFHLPVQSGSNSVLKRMNRGYTREKYLDLINNIKEKVPESSITTDFIVGFPGETDDDFNETLNLVREVEFDMAFTFIYSPRTGTPAAKMKDQISEDIKKDRLKRLIKLQNEISLKKNKLFEGKIVEVLVEGESSKNSEMYMGRTRGNKLILFPREDGIIGSLINVRIKEVHSWTLYGEILRGDKLEQIDTYDATV
jgi:tRNA-2-methylthio-N6-dimethylallyladenosine synthase